MLGRSALYRANGIDEVTGRLVDLYVGLSASDDDPVHNQTRAAILAMPDWRDAVGTLAVPSEVLEAAAGNREKVVTLLEGIMADKRMQDPAATLRRAQARPTSSQDPSALTAGTRAEAAAEVAAPKAELRVHTGVVWNIGKRLPPNQRKQLVQVVQRLFNAGIKRPDLLVAVARHFVDHAANIRNPFAYYSPGGEGFSWLAGRVNADRAIAEHQVLENATRSWLAG